MTIHGPWWGEGQRLGKEHPELEKRLYNLLVSEGLCDWTGRHGPHPIDYVHAAFSVLGPEVASRSGEQPPVSATPGDRDETGGTKTEGRH